MENINELKKTFEKRNFYTTKDTGKIFLYALLLPLALGLVLAYVSMAIVSATGHVFEEGANIFTEMFQEYLWFAVLNVMLTEIIFLCLYFCYNKANRIKVSSCNVHFKQTNVWTAILSAAVGIVSVLGLMWLIEGCFGALFDVMGVSQNPEDVLSLPLNTVGWYFVNLLVLGVLPAVCEELIFRGMIFQGLKEHFSKWTSVLLSALLFALMHQNIEQLIYPFVLGIVLAEVMDRTGNLLYPMIIHLFNNFTTITLNFLVEVGVLNLSFNITWWGILLAILIAGLTGIVFWLLDRFYLSKQKKIEMEMQGQTVQKPPLSIGKMPVTLIVGIVLAVSFLIVNTI